MGFVDDKRIYVNDCNINKLVLINKNLERVANNWSKLLETSGGGLELSKCSHDTLHWKFNKDGRLKISERFYDIEL